MPICIGCNEYHDGKTMRTMPLCIACEERKRDCFKLNMIKVKIAPSCGTCPHGSYRYWDETLMCRKHDLDFIEQDRYAMRCGDHPSLGSPPEERAKDENIPSG